MYNNCIKHEIFCRKQFELFSTISDVLVFKFLTLANFFTIHAGVSAKVCYFAQEPNPSRGHQLQWVMVGSKDERCSCTNILAGGVNTRATKTPYEKYYTDQPLFTQDVEEIHDYFDCHDESMMTTKKTQGNYCLYGV